jgi:hypothetical protein
LEAPPEVNGVILGLEEFKSSAIQEL